VIVVLVPERSFLPALPKPLWQRLEALKAEGAVLVLVQYSGAKLTAPVSAFVQKAAAPAWAVWFVASPVVAHPKTAVIPGR